MYSLKAKVKPNKTLQQWFKSTSQKAAQLYNQCLDYQFSKADFGDKLYSKFDLINSLRSNESIQSDYKDRVAERAFMATEKWYSSEQVRYDLYWKHKDRAERRIKNSNSSAFGKQHTCIECFSEYKKHCKNLYRKQVLVGRPRRKKKISLKFSIRKNRQKTVNLRERTIEVSIPGKNKVRGRHNRLLPENSDFLFKDGILKMDTAGDMWLCLVITGERKRSSFEPKPNILVGVDCGLKTARTAVAVDATTGDLVKAFQPDRKRFFDKQLDALKQASNGDRRALPFVHRKIARRRHDTIEKEVNQILSMGDQIKVGKPSAAWLYSGRLARSAADVANSRFVDRLAKRAEVAGKESGEVNESYTTVTCRKCGTRRKMALRDRVYECHNSSCGHIEDRDINSAYQIAFRRFESSA